MHQKLLVIFLCFLTVTATVFAGWLEYNQNPFNDVRGFYESPHQLRKMFVNDEVVTQTKTTDNHPNTGFFRFIGSDIQNTHEQAKRVSAVTHISFSWNVKDDIYMISRLPVSKVRFKLVSTKEPPSVSFFLNEQAIMDKVNELAKDLPFAEGKVRVEKILIKLLKNFDNPSLAIANYLDYAVFTVNEDDWPENINLPLN